MRVLTYRHEGHEDARFEREAYLAESKLKWEKSAKFPLDERQDGIAKPELRSSRWTFAYQQPKAHNLGNSQKGPRVRRLGIPTAHCCVVDGGVLHN